MAIEEKQRALEFTYIPDGMKGELKYEISYDESKGMFPLTINTGGSDICYPLGLFTEVIEFLTSKDIIEPMVFSRTASSPGTSPPVTIMATSASPAPVGASIPIPQVTKSEDSASSLTSNTDPLASFDITSSVSVIPSSVEGPLIPETPLPSTDTPPIPKIIKADANGIIMQSPAQATFSPVDPAIKASQVPQAPPSKITSEMKSRPVIRSRVTGGDPQSAEKEAAMLRASSGKGVGKTIRKAHKTEG